MVKDIVCGMEVDSPSPHQSIWEGETFEFCSEKCKSEFDADPSIFVPKEYKTDATYHITSNGVEKVQLPIVDMNCASCAVTIEKEIRRLPGIRKAVVNGATEKAYVESDRSETSITTIIGAIKKPGYKAGYATLRLGIGGMHCASCVSQIEGELNQTAGVLSASIDLGTESALIRYISSEVDLPEIKQIIERLGYRIFDASRQPEPPKNGGVVDKSESKTKTDEAPVDCRKPLLRSRAATAPTWLWRKRENR